MTLPPNPLDVEPPDHSPDDVPDGDLDGGDYAADGADGATARDGAAGEGVADGADELKSVLQAELATDTTQHYLNRIGAKPLLGAEQEVALRHAGQGRRLQRAPEDDRA
jgi:RNA polymerase nonessential primary-like sigma factor